MIPAADNHRALLPGLCRPMPTCALLLVCGLLTGCGSLNSLQPRWAMARLRMDDTSIGDIQGPNERRLRSISRSRASEYKAQAHSEDLAEQFHALQQADQLYEQGQYAQAEQAYVQIKQTATPPKGFRRGLLNRHQFQDDLDQSPIEEDAIFGIAQSQFMQGNLSGAEETYSALLKEYPSTRHLDTVSRQLFRISREWLGFPDPNDEEIVRVVYGNNPPTIEQRRDRKDGWMRNFRDKSRPTFDVDGHALEALRKIWLNDAAGPLADDALMMAANYHLKKGDNISAAQHYRLLQEQFPDSQHFKDSLMLGSHVLLASYNGAGYDPSPLNEAKQLKLMALQYPDLNSDDRQRIEHELDELAEAEVEPYWKQVQFYIAKRQPESVVLQCNILINRFPNSRYARMAEEVRSQYVSSKKLTTEWPNVPVDKTVGNEGPQQEYADAYLKQHAAKDGTAGADSGWSLIPKRLRRAETPPALQQINPEQQSSSDPFLNTPSDGTTPADISEAGRVRLQSPESQSLRDAPRWR